MSHSRTRSLLLAAAVMAAALAPAAVAGAAAPGKADKARAEHDRIVAYWTPERMKAAKPRDFVRNADGSFSLAASPKGKPSGENKGKPGGDSTTSTTTSVPVTAGSSWQPGGEVLARTGKVYFRMNGSGWVCSGAVVGDGDTTNERSLVLTAAHCVYDESATDGSGFADYWMFIPDFDTSPNLSTGDCASADTSYGCWTAKALVANTGFTRAGGFTTSATLNDFAFAVVGLGGKAGEAKELDGTVGGYGLQLGGGVGDRMSAFGYPAALKYKGNDLTYCSGDVVKDPYNRVDGTSTPYTGADDNWGMACKMTGGSSGGPWIVTDRGTTDDGDDGTLGANGNGGVVSSLNSYGYGGVSYMFGPVFTDETTAVYEAAKSATANVEVLAG